MWQATLEFSFDECFTKKQENVDAHVKVNVNLSYDYAGPWAYDFLWHDIIYAKQISIFWGFYFYAWECY